MAGSTSFGPIPAWRRRQAVLHSRWDFASKKGDGFPHSDPDRRRPAVDRSPDAVQRTLGWELKPQGLCRGEACFPVRDRAALVRAHGIDLGALARVLDLPLAADVEAGVAVLGTSAGERANRLASMEAPDFTLPDLAGRLHSLRDQRGKKTLLIAWASW
jgi:hypothetical protein